MRILGVSGSPRKGNTEWMLRKLLEMVAQSGAEVELLLLRKMDIRMCRGCLTCEEGGMERKGDRYLPEAAGGRRYCPGYPGLL